LEFFFFLREIKEEEYPVGAVVKPGVFGGFFQTGVGIAESSERFQRRCGRLV
jgi:hypothetical protein